MLKTVVLPNIFAEKYFFLDSLINDSKEQHLFEIEIFCNIIKVSVMCLLIHLMHLC